MDPSPSSFLKPLILSHLVPSSQTLVGRTFYHTRLFFFPPTSSSRLPPPLLLSLFFYSPSPSGIPSSLRPQQVDWTFSCSRWSVYRILRRQSSRFSIKTTSLPHPPKYFLAKGNFQFPPRTIFSKNHPRRNTAQKDNYEVPLTKTK